MPLVERRQVLKDWQLTSTAMVLGARVSGLAAAAAEHLLTRSAFGSSSARS